VRRRRASGIALLALALGARAAAASPEGGLLGGFDAGFGEMSLDCADSCGGSIDHAGAAGLHIGWRLDPRLAVLYDAWVLVHPDESAFGRVLAVQTMHVAALQGWVAPRLWIRGGPGVAHLLLRIGEIGTRNDVVPALAAAVGYEALRRERMVLDVALRLGAGFFDEDEGQGQAVYSLSLGAGLSWD
jgi:hypothetical protein